MAKVELEGVFSETRLPVLPISGNPKMLRHKEEPGLLDLGLK
jgi:hypothetical protein